MLKINQVQQFGSYLNSILNNDIVNKESESLFALIKASKYHNRWFTDEMVTARIQSLALYLQSEIFENIYNSLKPAEKPLTIGYTSEEHIPLEEIIPILCLELCGHSIMYKITEHNDKLMAYLMGLLCKHTRTAPNMIFTEDPLKNFDLFYYCSRQAPGAAIRAYVSRHNAIFETRYQSVAVLTGKENSEELAFLANDVFSFFSQGSGNVRKVFVPEHFDIRELYPHFEPWHHIMEHNAYGNNFEYSQSVYLMNRIDHFDNGFLLLKNDTGVQAPTAVLYYEIYSDEADLQQKLQNSNYFQIYRSVPQNNNERTFGESIKQNFILSDKLRHLVS